MKYLGEIKIMPCANAQQTAEENDVRRLTTMKKAKREIEVEIVRVTNGKKNTFLARVFVLRILDIVIDVIQCETIYSRSALRRQ